MTTEYPISDQNRKIEIFHSKIINKQSILLLLLVTCIFPFALAPSGNCVNILIDITNCGIIGYVCPSNYTSCSNGQCITIPVVQLTNPIPIFTAVLNGSVDDTFYPVTVPFAVTLYNTTTSLIQVTTNGVRITCSELTC